MELWLKSQAGKASESQVYVAAFRGTACLQIVTECNLRPQRLSPEVAVALAQDKLCLKVTKDTYTRWVVKNWAAWTQWLLGIGVPATHMVRSRLSVDKGEREEFSLPGFACSTAALLALLCRWEVTLAGEGAKAAARDLRKAWVQHF